MADQIRLPLAMASLTLFQGMPGHAKAILALYVRARIALDGGGLHFGPTACDSPRDRDSRAVETLVPMTHQGVIIRAMFR
jgi:hypothetical protein